MRPHFTPMADVNWIKLSANPAAICILEHPDYKYRLYLPGLLANPAAVHLFPSIPTLNELVLMSNNPNQQAVQIVERHIVRYLETSRIFSTTKTGKTSRALKPFFGNSEIVRHKYMLIWCGYCKHTKSMDLIRKYIHWVEWQNLSQNPNAIDVLKEYPNNISWVDLCANPNPKIVDILQQVPNSGWYYCALSSNPGAIELLKQHPKMIIWSLLCANLNAISLIETNPDNILWEALCTNPNATHIIAQNTNKLYARCWIHLSANPGALDILRANPDKIDMDALCSNTNPEAMLLLFQYNYTRMFWDNIRFNDELFRYVCGPKHLCGMANNAGLDMMEYQEEI